MTDSKDFLINFTDTVKKEIGKGPIGFYHALDLLVYTESYHFDEEKNRLEDLKTVTDKILSILYHPAIHATTSEIVQRSELSGKLSHDSFSDTMRDPRLWKEKGDSMVPEYVHTVETIDNIDIYENRFLSLLIRELDEDISSTIEDMTPMVESLGEHYQSNLFTFGKYSPLRDMRKRYYPYSSFVLKGNGSKEELYNKAKKLKRRIRNMMGSEFYKITSKHPISKSVRPTNILIHDSLYSYCYKYYISHYKTGEMEERKRQILYFNYFFISFLHLLKNRKLLKEEEMIDLSFSEEGLLTFSPFSIDHYPFALTLVEDKENLALKIDVVLHYDNKDYVSSYYLLTRERYTEKNRNNIHAIQERKEGKFILVTGNNLVKDYDSVLTFSYHKEKNEELLDDLLSSLTILIQANKDVYSGLCPVCGKNHIHFDGNQYLCQDCHTSYVMDTLDSDNLLWILSYGKE